FLGFGYYGVDLFFVLSGFLITRILLTLKHSSFSTDLWRFVGRRTLRIFPPYYMTLVLILLLDFEQAIGYWLSLATYTFNYNCLDGGPFWLWSLSVEEQFYLIWPVFVLLCQSRTRLLILVTTGLCVASYSQLICNILPAIAPFHDTGLPNRMSSLCVGALGAVWFVNGSYRKVLTSIGVEIAALAVVLWGLLALRGTFFQLQSYQFPLIAVGSLILILKCAAGQVRLGWLQRILGSSWMIELGTVSYGIYLLHPPVGELLRSTVLGPFWHSLPFESLGPLSRLRWHSWVLSFPVCSGCSYLMAKLSWVLIERRILALKDRCFPAS
ncbi:MAG: acyltransferase family protein, partial [Planctomycetaceae bacterium]